MQRFDIRETQEISARGRYLRWDTDSGNPIGVRASGVDYGQLYPGELLELPEVVDKWLITPAPGEVGFVRVGLARVDSDRKNPQSRVPVLMMETGVAQVAAGAGPGWVSGDPAGLVASGNLTTVYDLGPEWRQYRAATISANARAGGGGMNLGFYWNDVPVLDYRRSSVAPGYASAVGSQSSLAAVANGGPISLNHGVMGRYLVLTVANASASLAVAAGSSISVGVFPS